MRTLTSKVDCYHLADVQSRNVRLPADGPEKAVHFLDGSDLLLVILLLWIFGDKRHLQPSVRFTHRLHLRILPQIHTRVLQFFGAVCAYEAVKVPQNLQSEYESTWRPSTCIFITAWLHTFENLNLVFSWCVSYSCLSNNEGCFGPQGGKDACHLHCNITRTDNHTAPVEKTELLIIGTNFKHGINTEEDIYAYFGRVSSSKKPSLVMPRLAPEMINKHNILHNFTLL